MTVLLNNFKVFSGFWVRFEKFSIAGATFGKVTESTGIWTRKVTAAARSCFFTALV
ncbi:MAG: hypothetical protein HC942_03855 [Microcoleus sp. SU_5_6]|nr:hypothetical protein [Microcoleus sp. SU_5_6]NJL69174.1 hypothetical protein [Microcoleus sp. SM1_3_4]